MKKALTFLVVVLLLIRGLGLALDDEAERVSAKKYQLDENGVIENAGPLSLIKGSQRATVLIQGLLENREMFEELAHTLSGAIPQDIHIPLLPHLGKPLGSLRKFNNVENLAYLEKYLKDIASKYEQVNLLLHSYASSSVIELHRERRLPSNLRFIFYAPALFCVLNNLTTKVQLGGFLLFRKYCAYDAIGCTHPPLGSGDEGAREFILRQKNPPYVIPEAVLQVFELDNEDNRSYYEKFPEDYHLMIAVDDNRVDYQEHERVCKGNSRCRLVSFPSGKHLVHQGNRKLEFARKVIEIVERS